MLDWKDAIVNDTFRVADEVRDRIALFDQRNATLTPSGDLMHDEAKKYCAQYDNLNLSKQFVTVEGYSLGHWLDTQHRIHTGKVAGSP